VFDRFYRGANARTSGSGLGLAIVRQMADRFGWRVVIESGPGEGTEVRILFPPTSPKLHSS
jgi:signal transduction histidine kinase